tara:strand:+ start:326 stop:826 length:501 start_codon:yes stop_codon:yes gene_type:complete
MNLFLSFLVFSSIFLNQNKEKHKFYVSTTTIEYKKEKSTFQITSQLFIDDVETLLREYKNDIKLAPDSNNKKIDELLEIALKQAFQIKIDKKRVDLIYIGREYKNDILQCYLEVIVPELSEKVTLQNRIFFNIFKNQQNIIHFKNKDIRKSVLLDFEEDNVTFSLI